MVVHICNPGYSGGGDKRLVNLRSAQVKLVSSYLRNKMQKQQASFMAPGLDHLPNMCKVLGSSPSTQGVGVNPKNNLRKAYTP
jgi:hypothetical protein